MITVREVIDVAMPGGAKVMAGDAGLDADVSWATRPAPNPPAFGHLRGGEFIFLTPQNLKYVDERLTLDSSLIQLAGFGVAAVAFSGRITPNARAASDRLGLPLVQLPTDTDLTQLEREAAHLINERRRELHRRGHDVSRRFMEMAISGESLATLVDALAEVSNAVVVIEGRDGRMMNHLQVASRQQDAVMLALEETRADSASWLRGALTGSPAEPPVARFVTRDGWIRSVSPIFGRDGHLGSVSFLVQEGKIRPELNTIASRGAAACAVILSRELAAAQARQELELNVLDEVLDGALRSEVSLLQQAKRLGFDLHDEFAAIVGRIDRGATTMAVRGPENRQSMFEEALGNRNELLWRFRHNQAEILVPVANGTSALEHSKSIFEDLRARVERKGESLSMGAGRPYSGIEGIRASHLEARQALLMGRRLGDRGTFIHFDDLGVFRLVFAAQELPELRAFHDEALTTLIEYDQGHNADLVGTLWAYFNARCGPKEAAALLGVHRNTVLYRLERIAELTGLDLDDADVRLRLHLAVTINLALFGNHAGRVDAAVPGRFR